MKMLTLGRVLLITLLLGCFLGCSKVPVGYQGIKVYLLGGKKGVDHEVLSTGRYWIGINEELYLFPHFIQNVIWTKDQAEGSPTNQEITFQDMDGLTITGDFGFSYMLEPEKIPKLFQKHRKGIDEITDVYIRTAVRKEINASASKRKVDNIYGAGKTAFIDEILANLKTRLDHEGFIIKQFAPIGAFRLPPQVLTALDAKIKATQTAQQRQNEVQEEKAKADKRREAAKGIADSVLTVAEAQAKANRRIAASVTATLVAYEKIRRWDGVLPKVAGGAGTLIDLRDRN